MRPTRHTPKDVIRAMVADSGMSMREASVRLGKSPTWLSATLAHKGDVQMSTFEDVADLCGFKVVVTRRDQYGDAWDVPWYEVTYRAPQDDEP